MEEAGSSKPRAIQIEHDNHAMQVTAEECYQRRGPRIDLTNLAQCILLGYTLGMEKEYGQPSEYLKAIAVVPSDVNPGHVLGGGLLKAGLPSTENAQYTVYALL